MHIFVPTAPQLPGVNEPFGEVGLTSPMYPDTIPLAMNHVNGDTLAITLSYHPALSKVRKPGSGTISMYFI